MKNKYVLILLFLMSINVYGQNKIPIIKSEKNALALLPDTAERTKLLKDLSVFLAYVDYGAKNNPLVAKEILKENEEPYYWLTGIASAAKNKEFELKPRLLAVVPRNSKFVIKIAYDGIAKDDKTYKLETVATLVAERRSDHFYFLDTFKENINNWSIKKVGHIQFFYEDKIDLNKAKSFARINKTFARKFSMKEVEVRYFKFINPEHLFKTLGFDYLPNMYFSNSGGLAEPWSKTLFAGNNSEIYTHELVHFYLREQYPNISRSFDEGYATYVGGSGDVPLSELKKLARNYLVAHPNTELEKTISDFGIRVEGNVPIAYVMSGLVCQFIESKSGFQKLKEVFNLSQELDYFTAIEKATGMRKEKVLELLNSALKD